MELKRDSVRKVAIEYGKSEFKFVTENLGISWPTYEKIIKQQTIRTSTYRKFKKNLKRYIII